MQRKLTPNALPAAFLLVSAALSVAVLAARNLYDDEISSLSLIAGPVARILQVAREEDIHPPGMYLLAHFSYGILPSFRWMNLFPCLFLYAGLAVFLFQVAPLFARTRSQLCLLLLATLHPQLLLWSNTFRWYSWWTGLALITLAVALQPRIPQPRFGATRALSLGVLLACLFYLNYITLLFALALGVAMLLRYRTQTWRRLLPLSLLVLGVFLALITLQLRTMLTLQLPANATQRIGLAGSFLRLLQSIAASEAYLPWHPLALVATLLFVILCVAGAIAMVRRLGRRSDATASETGLASLILFFLLFFLLVAASGLGGKPRNGLLLIPVLAPAAALCLESLSNTLRPRMQSAALLFLALWSAVGIAHILGRYGLTKASMNDHPEQVAAFIRQTAGPGCAVVVTYDSELAFTLTQAHLPQTIVVSTSDDPVIVGPQSLPVDRCVQTRLYAVQSYLGENTAWAQTLNGELLSSTQFLQSPPRIDSFSLDPDASRKRALASLPLLHGDLAAAAQLPDYRYIVTSGPIDRASLTTLHQRMPDFVSGSE